MTDTHPPAKWYHRPYWLVVAFLCVGPLALPLLWTAPAVGRGKKIAVTVLVVVASYYLGLVFVESLASVVEYYRLMNELLGQ